MEANRAKQIAESPVMANVTFHGTPIYIEGVDESSRLCQHSSIKLTPGVSEGAAG